jgi:hypothetical protein
MKSRMYKDDLRGGLKISQCGGMLRCVVLVIGWQRAMRLCR